MDALLNSPYYAVGALGLAVILAFLVRRHQRVEFPDHAAISGVPLPTPLLQFDIDTAKPRPYRPFRWSVHSSRADLGWRLTIRL